MKIKQNEERKKERKKERKIKEKQENTFFLLSLNRRGIRNFSRAFLWLPNKPPSEISSSILFHRRFHYLPEPTSDDLSISLAGNRCFGRFLHTLCVKLLHRVNLRDSQRHLLAVRKKRTENYVISRRGNKNKSCCILVKMSVVEF